MTDISGHRIVSALGGQNAIRRLCSFSRNTLVRFTGEVHRRGTVPGLLSIIVPVYNVEEYLDECLGTLRFQQHQKARTGRSALPSPRPTPSR
jgi:hypothetical protein